MLVSTNIGAVVETPKALQILMGQNPILYKNDAIVTLTFPSVTDPAAKINLSDRLELLGEKPYAAQDKTGTTLQISETIYGRFFGPNEGGIFKPLFKEYPNIIDITDKQRDAIMRHTGAHVIGVMDAGQHRKAIALSGSIDGAKERLQKAVGHSVIQTFNDACLEKKLNERDMAGLKSAFRNIKECTDRKSADEIVWAISKEHGKELARAFYDVAEQSVCPSGISRVHRPSYEYGIIAIPNVDYQRLFGTRALAQEARPG